MSDWDNFWNDVGNAVEDVVEWVGDAAEDVAETIYWSATLPRRVNVNRLQLMPVMQAFGPFAVDRG